MDTMKLFYSMFIIDVVDGVWVMHARINRSRDDFKVFLIKAADRMGISHWEEFTESNGVTGIKYDVPVQNIVGQEKEFIIIKLPVE